MKTPIRCVLAAALAGAISVPAAAQDGGSEWNFTVAPYLLTPSMDGDVAVRGVEAEVDLGPLDIFGNLNIGFMGYFEAAHESGWAVGLDASFMNLDATDDDSLAEADASQGAYSLTVLRRVGPGAEIYAGARLNTIKVDLDFQGPLGLESRSQSKDWIDPLIGARISAPLNERWTFSLTADVGGFGVGSDLAVNVWPALRYNFSPGFGGTIGYRVLYTDYDSGAGAERFVYDVLTAGPTLGLDFRF